VRTGGPGRSSMAGLALAAVVGWAPGASAHEARPALLALKEMGPALYSVAWYPPVLPGAEARVVPRFPPGCIWEGPRLTCSGELSGRIQIEGLERLRGRGPAEILFQVSFLAGDVQTAVLSAGRPFAEIGPPRAGGDDARVQIGAAYLKMGIEHILLGFDHLLFVAALVFLVGYSRRLVWTITAFTAAHSSTLAASALGWVRLPGAAVEVVIALSIALLAVECCKREETLTRRYPWLVSFGFGLLHGFGFAGALREIGLPQGQAALALTTFNLGVEIGQLALVGALYGLYLLVRAAKVLPVRLAIARTGFVYAVGGLACYWIVDRAAGLFF
jgi:hydrogenase/urease accessory protein HupE